MRKTCPSKGAALTVLRFFVGMLQTCVSKVQWILNRAKMQQFREAMLKTLESIGLTNPTAEEFFQATSNAAAAARKTPSIMPINGASTGCPATRGAVAAKCSPDVDISSSDAESGKEALSPDIAAAAKILAQMTARDAHPDADEDGNYHSSGNADGPHKQIRQEGLETLKKTRLTVDRADRGHCDRKLVPCLIIGVNRRQQFQLRCEDGVIETRHTAGDLQPFRSSVGFSFAAGDSIEGVQQVKVIAASWLWSRAKVAAVS
ncbi:TPA: hypothetical protein ACH3X2_005753 [Trebouxia sp. C0005]